MLLILTTSLLFSIAWLAPDTYLGFVLNIISSGLFYLQFKKLLENKIKLKYIYLGAVLIHLASFYWLLPTISRFSGLPIPVSFIIFILFALTHALQFVIVYKLASIKWLRAIPALIVFPFTWVSIEFLFPRLFPWYLGTLTISIPEFSQLASIGGQSLVSLILLFTSALFIEGFKNKKYFIASLLLLFGIYLLGKTLISNIKNNGSVTVSIVQPNIITEDKNNPQFLKEIIKRHLDLTPVPDENPKLVIWPESAISEWIPQSQKWINFIKNAFPDSLQNDSYLFGGLTYKSETEFYNSAIAVNPDGQVAGIYNKKVLMPFGEYTPLVSMFPALKQMNPLAAEFSAGDKVTTIDIKVGEKLLKVAPIICYEDLLPVLSSSAKKDGADILVNMTNDEWFGESPAGTQHLVISAFRTIETRLPMVRVTNSGVSAVIDAAGRIIRKLPSHRAISETVTVLLTAK